MERLLITGASGFIGSHLVRQALEAGFEVWAAVRKDSDKTRLTAQGVQLLEVDYYDEEQLFSALSTVPPRGEDAPCGTTSSTMQASRRPRTWRSSQKSTPSTHADSLAHWLASLSHLAASS